MSAVETMSTRSWDHKRSSSSSLENHLDILQKSFCHCRNGRGTVILIVPVHGPNNRFRDVNWPWNKEMVSSWSIHVVHLFSLQGMSPINLNSTTSYASQGQNFSDKKKKKIHNKSHPLSFLLRQL